jgi:Fur family ferric uptake transcriptional regulator
MTKELTGDQSSADKEPDLRSAGLKVTLPRTWVLELFRTSKLRHLTADEVFRQLAGQGLDVGLATVYRVLSHLEAVGLLTRHSFDGGKAVYELNEKSHHDHLICLTCGQVDEFTNDLIEDLQQQAAQAQGYELVHHRLALYGYCPACISKRKDFATPVSLTVSG